MPTWPVDEPGHPTPLAACPLEHGVVPAGQPEHRVIAIGIGRKARIAIRKNIPPRRLTEQAGRREHGRRHLAAPELRDGSRQGTRIRIVEGDDEARSVAGRLVADARERHDVSKLAQELQLFGKSTLREVKAQVTPDAFPIRNDVVVRDDERPPPHRVPTYRGDARPDDHPFDHVLQS